MPDWLAITNPVFSELFVGNVVMAFGIAALMYLLIEKPCSNLEGILTGAGRRKRTE